MSFFFQFFSKNPLLSSPYLVKKRRFCQNYTIFWVKKVNRMPFFSDFSRKNNCSNAHILSKNRPFSENNLLLSPYYVKKRIFSQKPNCSHIIIIKFFIKTPSVNAHIWSKNINSVKNSHYGPKKSIGCPFLPFFHEKITA